jgi:hypothetical protein
MKSDSTQTDTAVECAELDADAVVIEGVPAGSGSPGLSKMHSMFITQGDQEVRVIDIIEPPVMRSDTGLDDEEFYKRFSRLRKASILIIAMINALILPLTSTMSYPLIPQMAGV